MVTQFIGFGSQNKPRKPQALKLRTPGDRWISEEADSSAIPLDLMLANVRWVEGQEAIEILTEQTLSKVQRVDNYVTRPARKILDRYDFARAGGWVAQPGEVAYFKPFNPRLDFEKRKKIKYETPVGMPATPLLPFVPAEYAQPIFDRFSVTPLPSETFWQTVWRCGLPILITEGFKKALSLIAHGRPAIALRGVTCWRKKGSSELHDAIAHFTTLGRKVYICFDQDTKASTICNVHWEICKLGRALEEQGCKVVVMGWGPELGKGVDDVLVDRGEDAQSWLDVTIATAPTFEE